MCVLLIYSHNIKLITSRTSGCVINLCCMYHVFVLWVKRRRKKDNRVHIDDRMDNGISVVVCTYCAECEM